MLVLDTKTRVQLRKDAHHLHPLVLIGDSGLTPAVINEISRNLDIHGLIKIRASTDEREQRKAWWDDICTSLHAAPVGAVGKLLILFRPKVVKPDDSAKMAVNKKTRRRSANGGLKTVTVVKPSANPKRPHKKIEVTLKGNERITFGGLVKPRHVRQKSAKKLAMKAE